MLGVLALSGPYGAPVSGDGLVSGSSEKVDSKPAQAEVARRGLQAASRSQSLSYLFDSTYLAVSQNNGVSIPVSNQAQRDLARDYLPDTCPITYIVESSHPELVKHHQNRPLDVTQTLFQFFVRIDNETEKSQYRALIAQMSDCFCSITNGNVMNCHPPSPPSPPLLSPSSSSSLGGNASLFNGSSDENVSSPVTCDAQAACSTDPYSYGAGDLRTWGLQSRGDLDPVSVWARKCFEDRQAELYPSTLQRNSAVHPVNATKYERYNIESRSSDYTHLQWTRGSAYAALETNANSQHIIEMNQACGHNDLGYRLLNPNEQRTLAEFCNTDKVFEDNTLSQRDCLTMSPDGDDYSHMALLYHHLLNTSTEGNVVQEILRNRAKAELEINDLDLNFYLVGSATAFPLVWSFMKLIIKKLNHR